MFKSENADFHAEHYPKKASTAFTVGMLVAWDGSGAVEPAVAADTAAEIVGICMEAVASSDATNDKILISVPGSTARMRCAVTGGAAGVGDLIDLSDANTADSAASTTDALRVVKVISATEAIVRLNK